MQGHWGSQDTRRRHGQALILTSPINVSEGDVRSSWSFLKEPRYFALGERIPRVASKGSVQPRRQAPLQTVGGEC
jgi:hypothetical protein